MADDFLSGSIEEAASIIDKLSNAPAEEAAPAQASPEPEEIQPQPVDDEPSAEIEGNVSEEAQAPAIKTPTPATQEPKAQPASSPELEQRLSEAQRATQEAAAVKTQYFNALNTLVPQLEAGIRGEFADIKNLDDLQAVAQTDPERYNRFVFAQARLDQAQKAQAQAVNDEKQVQNKRLAEWKQQEHKKLGELIPDLMDNDKGPVLARKLQEFSLKSGYSAEQLTNASANDFAMLYRAMQFENMQALQKVAREKAAKAPPVQTPGTARVGNGVDKVKELYGRAEKTGRVDDLAAYFDAQARLTH